MIKEGVFAAIKEGIDIFLAESLPIKGDKEGEGEGEGDKEGDKEGEKEGKSIDRIVQEHGHSVEHAHLWLSRCR